jgi:flagella basal body P-ring formation protein FlgA
MINLSIKTKMIVILSFLLFVWDISALAILSSVKIKKETVALSDLVITTDSKLLKNIEKVQIGDIKVPGGKFIIREDELIAYLSPYLDLKDIKIPNKIIVERLYKSIEKSLLNEKIKNELDKYYIDTDYDYKIKISGGDVIRMPIGNLSYGIDFDGLDKELGIKNLKLVVYEDEVIVYSIPFEVEIGKLIREYTLKKDVKKGESFDESKVDIKENFVYQPMKINNLFFEGDDVFTRDMMAGSVLSIGDLEKDTLIKKGSKVIIKIKYKNMQLSDKGEALQNGDEGEEVEIKNLRTGKIIKAVILEDGSVEASIE